MSRKNTLQQRIISADKDRARRVLNAAILHHLGHCLNNDNRPDGRQADYRWSVWAIKWVAQAGVFGSAHLGSLSEFMDAVYGAGQPRRQARQRIVARIRDAAMAIGWTQNQPLRCA